LAYDFAKKAVDVDANTTNKFFLLLASRQLAYEKGVFGEFSNAYDLSCESISNYESIKSDYLVTNFIPSGDVVVMYNNAAWAAFIIGKTNEGAEYRKRESLLRGSIK